LPQNSKDKPSLISVQQPNLNSCSSSHEISVVNNKKEKKERKIYYAHDISIYKLSVEMIELRNYYIMMLYKLRLDVRSSQSSVSFRVGYCMLIIYMEYNKVEDRYGKVNNQYLTSNS
jgi:hypothetical protein